MATATQNKTTKKVPAEPRPKAQASKTEDGSLLDLDAADRVLEQVQSGGQNAIGAVRRFLDSADESIRGESSSPTLAHDLADSALEMSDRLVEYGGEAIRGIVRSASR